MSPHLDGRCPGRVRTPKTRTVYWRCITLAACALVLSCLAVPCNPSLTQPHILPTQPSCLAPLVPLFFCRRRTLPRSTCRWCCRRSCSPPPPAPPPAPPLAPPLAPPPRSRRWSGSWRRTPCPPGWPQWCCRTIIRCVGQGVTASLLSHSCTRACSWALVRSVGPSTFHPYHTVQHMSTVVHMASVRLYVCLWPACTDRRWPFVGCHI